MIRPAVSLCVALAAAATLAAPAAAYSSSPILADGKIYATSEDGTTTVLKAGPEFEILAVNKLDSHTLATPSPVGSEIFIRTAEHLYCIAKQ